MIRVALAVAWREVRLVAYRCAAIHGLLPRVPWRMDMDAAQNHRLHADQRAEVVADAEALARALLNAEGRR